MSKKSRVIRLELFDGPEGRSVSITRWGWQSKRYTLVDRSGHSLLRLERIFARAQVLGAEIRFNLGEDHSIVGVHVGGILAEKLAAFHRGMWEAGT